MNASEESETKGKSCENDKLENELKREKLDPRVVKREE